MPHSPLSPAVTPGPVDATTPVVHLTRRARIEAERAAAKGTVATAADTTARSSQAASDRPAAQRAVVTTTPAAPVSPVDLAPTSPAAPARPASRIATPPAPSSPVVAPVSSPSRRGTAPTARGAGRRGTRPVQVDRATRHIAATAPSSRPTATTGSAFRRAASRVTAVGALLFAAGLVVSTSLPAQALWVPESGSTAARASAGATQSLSVGDTAAGSTSRDQYTVSDVTQYQHVDASSFTNDPAGSIQWPFLTGVPITSGFGGRQVAGCSFCSTNHMGVDFAPGEGTPIRVIASGTVIKVQANDGGFGNDVWVQHDVDGKQFVSVYGHMEDNSFQVVTGQQVTVGDVLGLVGSTGNSTGPHLHLEVHVDGVPVDPLAWLEANAD